MTYDKGIMELRQVKLNTTTNVELLASAIISSLFIILGRQDKEYAIFRWTIPLGTIIVYYRKEAEQRN